MPVNTTLMEAALPMVALALKAKRERQAPRWPSPGQMAEVLAGGRWVMASHLDLLNRKLLDLVSGRSLRLIVEMPPRHGKSQFVSHWFPVWCLNEHPDWPIMLTSYEADFAASWGRQVRNSIAEHADRLTVRIAADSSAANRWHTTQAGGMVTAGVGGPITGRGARILICDDPVKNAEEANSGTYREKTWDWWQSTAYTRLEPGAGAILVMTRWHQSDLAGRLIEQMEQGGERWEVIRLPALAELGDPLGRGLGEALWPARYDADALDRIHASVGSYVWNALYQQNPIDREGGMFQRRWFEIVDAVPADARRVRYWDLAATEAKTGTDPDWTVGVKVAEKAGIYYIEDAQRTRSTPSGVELLVRQTAEMDGRAVPQYMEQEPGSSGVNTIDHYARFVLNGFVFKGIRTTGPKDLRAAPASAAAEAGNVKILRGPWNKAYLDEMEAFPTGTHDDQVDGTSGAMQQLTTKQRQWSFH